MSRTRHWIPPLPLAAGLVFQLAAWLIALAYGVAPSAGLAFAWIHAVALGWITLTALAVLMHVIPAFTDLPWRAESVARTSIAVLLLGALTLVGGFIAGAPYAVAFAAAVLVLAITGYVAAAVATLAQRAEDRQSAAIARALSWTLLALLLTALLGGVVVRAYLGAAGVVAALPLSHALLGIGAWLSVLTAGVSARTFRPLLGVRSRSTVLHVASGTGLLFGPLIAAIGAPLSVTVLRFGLVLTAIGAFTYAADALDIVARATTPHPPARAFVIASIGWLLVATGAMLAAAWGAPLAAIAIVCALAGWIGQMVNAHVHHLGVRVLITLLRGDEDETRPWQVLDARLTWTAFVLAQLGVAGVAAGLALGAGPAIVAGAVAGALAIPVMAANAVHARRTLLRTTVVV